MAKKKKYTGTGSDKPEAKKGPLLPIKIDTKKSAQRVEDAEQVPIFEVDDKVFSMSSAPRAEVGLRFIELMSTEGPDRAAHYLLTETLGEKAYHALTAVVGLQTDDFQGVLLRVQALVLPKGAGSNRKQRRA